MALLTSLVIPSRGGARRLPRLMQALAQQTAPIEAVVVLDGDIDGSRQALDPWLGELDLQIVEFDANRGRAAALNAGFTTARGEVLVRCDDDLAPAPDFAAVHASHHEGSPVGVIGQVRNQFPDTAYARAYGRDWDLQHLQEAYATPPERRWQHWAANASVTRETWQRVGPYDADTFQGYGWEDVDWGYRLHRAGIPIVIDAALETDHFLAAVTTETRVRRAYQAGGAKALFEAKHGLEAAAPGSGAWSRATQRAADHLTEASSTRWAARLDSGASRLPRPVARKLVAFLVESASIAGHLHPDDLETTP